MPGRYLLLLLLLATACVDGPEADRAATRGLRLGADVDAETLDPRLMRNTTSYRVVNLIYDGLVELDPSLEPQPSLARSWETPEDTVWIFHLRPGVRFQDGTALTADDVVYTFESILDPVTQARFRTLYEPIASIVALDSLTVRLDLSEPYAPLLGYLDVGIVPRRYVERGGNLSSAPVGTGPMRLASWIRGTEIRMEAFRDHWRGPPAVSEFTFVIVADNTARAQAFEAGDLDLVQSPLSPQDIRRLASDDGSRAALTDGVAVTYLNFNVAFELLADPRMRRALAMMVDQRTIVDVIYEGVDRVATSVLLPGSWAYTDRVRQPSFDPTRAGDLLKEMGWRDSDGDGFLDRNGRTLSLELSTHAEDPNRIQAVEFLQSTLRENGVDARVSVTSWPAFFADVQEGRHEIALLGWTNIVDPDRLLYTQFLTDGDLNYGRYSNAEVDRLLVSARASLDRDLRARAYAQAAEILADEVPYFVLSYQGYHLFHRPDLVLEPDPRGYMRSLLGLAPQGS
jgi:peptide/nickel transport system substrate-binding protein